MHAKTALEFKLFPTERWQMVKHETRETGGIYSFSCSWDLWPHPDFFKLIRNLTLPYCRTDFKKEQVMKAGRVGGGEGGAMTSSSPKIMFEKFAFRIVS